MDLEVWGSYYCNTDRWCEDIGQTGLCCREARWKRTSGFDWKLWLSQLWGKVDGNDVDVLLAGSAEKTWYPHYWETSSRKDWVVRVGSVSGDTWLSSWRAPSPPHGIYPPKEPEQVPCWGKWQAALLCFLSAVLLEEAEARGLTGHGRGNSKSHPGEHCHMGWVCHISLANACEMMEEEWQSTELSEYKQAVSFFSLFIFKSGLCHTIMMVTIPFVLWSRSIGLLLGQDKGLDSPENKLLVFPLLFKLPLSWKLLAAYDDFFYVFVIGLCWCQNIRNR